MKKYTFILAILMTTLFISATVINNDLKGRAVLGALLFADPFFLKTIR